MPVFNDFWSVGDNREKYQHIVPEMVHKDKEGRSIGWDAGNKCFRFLNAQGNDFQGSPHDLPKRKNVSDIDFIKAYFRERDNGGSLESLIRSLGYYKNNVQGLRARISDLNKHLKLAIIKNMGPDKGNALIASQKDNPTKMLYGLTSAHTLRGAPREGGPDLDALWGIIGDK